MKKHLLSLLTLSTFVLVGCGTVATNNEEKTPETVETETYTLDFNSDFVAKGNSGNGPNAEKLREDFNATLLTYFNHDKEIVESLNTTGYVQIYSKNESDTKKLMVGDTNENGAINLTFKTKLVSVKVYAQAQYSEYDRYWPAWDEETGEELEQGYVVINKNIANKISVNDQEWDLGFGHYGETVYKSQEEAIIPQIIDKTFEINSKSLTISGKAGERTFIHKLEMTVEK